MADRGARVRAAQAGDRDQVWPLARDLATSFRLERAAFDGLFGTLLTDPHTLLLVAELPEGAITGYLLAFRHPAFHANGPVAWVEEVMVASQSRRTGVGRHLMAAAEQWARSGGASYLALATRRAASFYRALGYEDSAAYFRKTLA
jgi:GNAT superfamily N-acetyltransferase